MSTVRVGLVSDSHGRFECLSRMADAAPDVAAWIHCGDYCDDGEDLAIYTGVPVYAVLGNNDYMTHTNDPECRCVTVGGIRIVAGGPRRLWPYAPPFRQDGRRDVGRQSRQYRSAPGWPEGDVCHRIHR